MNFTDEQVRKAMEDELQYVTGDANAVVTVKVCGLNKQQVKWASQHDWFVDSVVLDSESVKKEYAVYVKEWQEGMNSFMHVTFTDFNKLRAWAGY
jgi:hypothetical protein